MKKGLLILFVAIIATLSAQDTLPVEKYWKDAQYPFAENAYKAWDSATTNLEFIAAISVENSQIVSGLSGITDFTNPELTIKADGVTESIDWQVAWGERYKLTGSNDELLVEMSIADGLYSSFQFDCYRWKNDAPTTKIFGETSLMNGYIIDMDPYYVDADDKGYYGGTISGEIFVPSAFNKDIYDVTDQFIVRASVYDAHGHEWNAGGDPFDTITTFDAYVPFTVDYNTIPELAANAGDGWGSTFNGVDRPILKDAIRAPIDFTKIVGVRFYLCPGKAIVFDENGVASADNIVSTAVATVKLKNIVIGSKDDAEPFDPTYAGVISSIEEDIAASGSAIASIEVINTLGQIIDVVETLSEVPAGVSILRITLEDGSVVSKTIAK